MKHFSVFVLSIILLATGCSTPKAPSVSTQEFEPAAAPVDAALAVPSEAAAAAKRVLETEGFTWVGSPEAALAERMTYAEAAQHIPAMSDPQYSPLWPDGLVWLVIIRGEWDLMPMGPPGATLVPNRYQGCLMVLLTARDGQVVAMGDTLCPGP